jgi:hypothetical protein
MLMTEYSHKQMKIAEEIEKKTCDNKLKWTRINRGYDRWQTFVGEWKVVVGNEGCYFLELSNEKNRIHIDINSNTSEVIRDIVKLVQQQEEGMGGIYDKILSDLAFN